MTWAGKTWRLSSEPVDVIDSAGTSHHYYGGLPPQDVGQEVGFLDVGEAQTWEGEVILPTNVAQLVERGYPIEGSRVSIHLWRRGDVLERAYRVFDGRVSSATPGAANAPVTLRAEAVEDVRAVFPDPLDEINDETIYPGNYRPSDRHKRWPWVFGFPGRDVNDGFGVGAWVGPVLGDHAPATPGYALWLNPSVYIDQDLAALWGHIPPPASAWFLLVANGQRMITARTLGVWNATTQFKQYQEVFRAFDQRGRPMWVTYHAASIVNGTDDFYVSWEDTSPPTLATGGLTSTRDEDRAARGAGEIMRWALERSGEPVDWRRFGAIRRHLDRFILAGYWDDPCAPWEWVKDNLVPILPLSIYRGPDGITPVFWRWWATADNVPRELEDGRNCAFGPEVETEGGDDLIGEVKVSYCPEAGRGGYRRVYTAARDSIGTRINDLTRRGGYRDAVTRAKDIETDVVFDHATASLIARWNLAARANARKLYTISGDYRIGDLEPGDTVRLVCPRLGLSNAVGHVRAVRWKGTAAAEIKVMTFLGVP
jgi:hypothetical protein